MTRSAPNVLLITADQWRADCLSAVGHPVVETPALDALAAEGTLFRNHFAQASPCGPSRASLLSGMYLMNHRSVYNGTPLDSRFTNLAREVRSAGLDAVLVGYTDTSADPRQHAVGDPALKTYAGVLPGFRQLIAGSEMHYAWGRDLARKGYELPPGGVSVDAFHEWFRPAAVPGKGPTFAPATFRAEDSDTAFAVNAAIEFVRYPERRPWLLHLSLLRPHPPFLAPAPYNAMYDAEDVPPFVTAGDQETEAAQHPLVAYMMRHHLRKEGLAGELHPHDKAARQQLRATYYGLMREVDDNLGRLFETLRDIGEYDNTLIIFTTDHGEQLWDHWMLGKQSYFDQSFHIPLIIRAPGSASEGQRGRQVNAFTESVDVMPTILEACGATVPLQCDGFSLADFLAGEEPKRWRDAVVWEMDFREISDGTPEHEIGVPLDLCSYAAIRDEEYKYIHFPGLPAAFYDLTADPYERRNLAEDPAYSAIMLTYAQKLLSRRMAHAERSLTGVLLTPDGPIERPRSDRLKPGMS